MDAECVLGILGVTSLSRACGQVQDVCAHPYVFFRFPSVATGLSWRTKRLMTFTVKEHITAPHEK